MKKILKKINNIKIRLNACKAILFKDVFWVAVFIDIKNATKQINGESYDIKYSGEIPKFTFFRTLKDVSNKVSDVDMICMKAVMEAEMQEQIK